MCLPHDTQPLLAQTNYVHTNSVEIFTAQITKKKIQLNCYYGKVRNSIIHFVSLSPLQSFGFVSLLHYHPLQSIQPAVDSFNWDLYIDCV